MITPAAALLFVVGGLVGFTVAAAWQWARERRRWFNDTRAPHELSMREAMRTLTLTVRVVGLQSYWARWCVARWLIVLAARVAGCGLSVDIVAPPYAPDRETEPFP